MSDYAEPVHHAFGATVQRARKTYKCDECGRTIVAGERYDRATFIQERGDTAETFRACEHCMAARTWLQIVCSGWLYNAIREDLEEHWHESTSYRSLHLGRLIVGMRRHWTRRDGTLMPIPIETTEKMVPVAA